MRGLWSTTRIAEEDSHVHRRLWRSRGGRDTADNLELLHANCHRRFTLGVTSAPRRREHPLTARPRPPAWRERGAGVVVGFGGSSAGPAAVAGAGAGAAVAFDGSPPAAGAVTLPGTVAVLASPFAVEAPFFFLPRPFPFEILMGRSLVVAGDHLGAYFSPCASKWCKKAAAPFV